MLIGAHADDDMLSHGTLAMLQAHRNQVYVVTLTTGNVGTQDPNLSRTQLAQIRRQEEVAALAELGIPDEHYINLGYDGLSDPLRAQLGASHLEASIDDKPTKVRAGDFDHESLTIDLPPGLGKHAWKLRAAKNSKEP